MGAQHRHAHAGDADAQVGGAHDLAQFARDLDLLAVLAGFEIDLVVVAEDVERVGVGQHAWFEGAVREMGFGRGAQFFHCGRASARRRLIGRSDNAADLGLAVQRPERHGGDDGGAVRIGDDALVLERGRAVDFRYDERHVFVHAEGGGVVDDDGLARRGSCEFLRGRAAGGEERDVDVLETVGVHQVDANVAALKRRAFAGRAGRGEQLQSRERELAGLKASDHLGADRAGRADDGDGGRGRQRAGAAVAGGQGVGQ